MSYLHTEFPSFSMPTFTNFWHYQLTTQEELEQLDLEESAYKSALIQIKKGDNLIEFKQLKGYDNEFLNNTEQQDMEEEEDDDDEEEVEEEEEDEEEEEEETSNLDIDIDETDNRLMTTTNAITTTITTPITTTTTTTNTSLSTEFHPIDIDNEYTNDMTNHSISILTSPLNPNSNNDTIEYEDEEMS